MDNAQNLCFELSEANLTHSRHDSTMVRSKTGKKKKKDRARDRPQSAGWTRERRMDSRAQEYLPTVATSISPLFGTDMSNIFAMKLFK